MRGSGRLTIESLIDLADQRGHVIEFGRVNLCLLGDGVEFFHLAHSELWVMSKRWSGSLRREPLLPRAWRFSVPFADAEL